MISAPSAILIYNDKQRAKAEEFLHEMVDRAIAAEGTCTVGCGGFYLYFLCSLTQ